MELLKDSSLRTFNLWGNLSCRFDIPTDHVGGAFPYADVSIVMFWPKVKHCLAICHFYSWKAKKQWKFQVQLVAFRAACFI